MAILTVSPSRAQSLFGEIRQNRHSRRIRRIRQNRRFVGTPILSSIDLRQNFVKIAILAEFTGFVKIAALSVPLSRAQSIFGKISSISPFSPNSPDSSKSPLCRYPNLDLNRSLAKSVKIAILAKFAGFVKIAASSVPLSRAQSLFGKISSKSPFLPNSPDSSKSPLCRYPHLELNRSLAKSVKIAILAKFAGFVKIAASSVPLSRAQSLFGKISSKSLFSPNSPDSSKSPLCRCPYLELNRSSAKFCQNRHSRRIRRIRQNRRFVGTPSRTKPLFDENRQNHHSRRIRRIRQNRRFVGTPISS